MEQGSKDTLRYAYIRNDVSEGTSEVAIPMWKARYSVWTHLGDWLSDDCYRAFHKEMISENSAARKRRLEQLLQNGHSRSWREEKKSAFLSTLEGVWEDLRVLDQAPEDYLDGSGGQPDSERYGARFDKKLATDLRLAEDEHFRNRYILGYEFPPIPKFRQDAEAWHSFTLSWCESILLESQKAKRLSLLARAVSALVESKGTILQELAPEELLALLRERWNVREKIGKERLLVSEFIANYFALEEEEEDQ